VRFDIKLSLRLSGISPKGFGLLGHNWWVTILLGKTAMRELGYGHLLIRVKPEGPGFFGLNPLSLVLVGFGWFWLVLAHLWITTCNFSELPLLSPSIHRKVGQKAQVLL
jgi:hypothetical protein